MKQHFINKKSEGWCPKRLIKIEAITATTEFVPVAGELRSKMRMCWATGPRGLILVY